MNIWDSVQRGLEKASNEAGRIAKGQRLRSSIEKLGRQVSERETALVNSVMHLFTTGALTQTELHPLCQELVQMRQQIAQLQSELQQLNTPPPAPPGTGFPGANTGNLPQSQVEPPAYLPQPGDPYQEIAMALPPDHPYADTANATPTPPPPPGMLPSAVPPPPPGFTGATINSQETQWMPPGPVTSGALITCSLCGKPTQSASSFCQHCGASLASNSTNQPTMRAEQTDLSQLPDNITQTDIQAAQQEEA